jgi:hypothetical protein
LKEPSAGAEGHLANAAKPKPATKSLAYRSTLRKVMGRFAVRVDEP